MAHIPGHDRSQLLLLPEAVDDYVAADNPVRFIEVFVDGLDLAALGFIGTVPKATGRPGYAPADLLKLYIYGYLNRTRSSRRLEAETHRNIEVIWLLRHLKPDFKTIADFRRINHKAFRPVFRQFVLLCRELNLFGKELLAVNGTRIKAVNNKDRNFTRASLKEFIRLADAKLDDYLHRLDRADAAETGTSGSRVANLAEKIAAVRGRRERCLTRSTDRRIDRAPHREELRRSLGLTQPQLATALRISAARRVYSSGRVENGGMLDRQRRFGGKGDSQPHSAATRAAMSPARSGRLSR